MISVPNIGWCIPVLIARIECSWLYLLLPSICVSTIMSFVINVAFSSEVVDNFHNLLFII